MNVQSLSTGLLALFPVGFLGSNWYMLSLTLLVLSNTWIFLLYWIARTLLRHIILRKSFPRRKVLIETVKKNKEELTHTKRHSPNSDDGDWEHVGPSFGKPLQRKISPETGFDGFIGFFHPFANAGGGGERVLWAAVKATQDRWPNAVCVVYTGDHQSTKADIIERVKQRFDIDLQAPSLIFLYLQRRDWVVASSYPHFTLLLQSLGSIVVAHEALTRLTPDIFIDTMGYAFSTWYCKLLFPNISIGSYVHYPFIGTHMVDSLSSTSGQGVNAGKGKGLRGFGKKLYWNSLLQLYIWIGTAIDSIMTNSSWTQAHMQRIWGAGRKRKGKQSPKVVYPPCSVEEIIDKIPLEGQHALPKESMLLCIAQFRPEKNHELLLNAFAEMDRKQTKGGDEVQLVLVGSVRDSDDETLVYKLRLLVKELKIDSRVHFKINAPWDEILELLKRASIGVNGMWCEHFGIGVVEYQAAGLICVVNDSGGPKEDIVVPYEGQTTGYHASTASEYALSFEKALKLPSNTALSMRKAARGSSRRFTEAIFSDAWTEQIAYLMSLLPDHHPKQS